MRRGSGKHQSAGEALGTGSRSVAMLFIFARQSRGILMRALAEAAAHHFRETHQGRLKLLGIRSIFVISVLVADGFSLRVLADCRIEPATRILAASLASESQPPFAEVLL